MWQTASCSLTPAGLQPGEPLALAPRCLWRVLPQAMLPRSTHWHPPTQASPGTGGHCEAQRVPAEGMGSVWGPAEGPRSTHPPTHPSMPRHGWALWGTARPGRGDGQCLGTGWGTPVCPACAPLLPKAPGLLPGEGERRETQGLRGPGRDWGHPCPSPLCQCLCCSGLVPGAGRVWPPATPISTVMTETKNKNPQMSL